ncbi:MAG TPA: DciA family protein, partial [Mycobacteriales bacterium]
GVLARWPELVGPDIAGHSRPVSLQAGELVVQAQSTAWATQLRLLAPRLVTQINTGLGRRLVNTVRVNGPTAPSWHRGPLRVNGPGPRDTYG